MLTFADAGDGRRVLNVLGKRLGRYGLQLHPEKTSYVDLRRPRGKCGHVARTTFDFLGFTHAWARSRKGRWVLRQSTARKRYARRLKAVAKWCRKHRHKPLREQQARLASIIRGHCNYYGRTGNGRRLTRFRHQVATIWRKWLSRRSRTSRVNWGRMKEILRAHPLPLARVVHSIYAT